MNKRLVAPIMASLAALMVLGCGVPGAGLAAAATAPPVIDTVLVRSEAVRVASLDAGRRITTDDPLARHASTVLGLLQQHCTEPLSTLVDSAVAATATLKQAGFSLGPVQILEDTMVALPAYVTRVSCAHWIPEDVTLTEHGG